MNPVSNLEPTKNSYCSKIDENNCAPTKKPKVLSVSVKLFCLGLRFETISTRCLARDQNIPTLTGKIYRMNNKNNNNNHKNNHNNNSKGQ